MTNYEKNKEWFDKNQKDIVSHRSYCVRKDGRISWCNETFCSECLFREGHGGCFECRRRWLDEEYKEPEIDWSKVEVDTKILVSDDRREWKKRYFAKCKNGEVCAWPYGSTSWSKCNDDCTPWRYAKLAKTEEEGKNE